MKSILRALVVTLFLLAPASHAQAVADTPEAEAGAMYSRMQAGDMRGAAELFDPAALKEFHDMLGPVMGLLAEDGDATPMLGPLFGGASPKQLKSASDAATSSRGSRSARSPQRSRPPARAGRAGPASSSSMPVPRPPPR